MQFKCVAMKKYRFNRQLSLSPFTERGSPLKCFLKADAVLFLRKIFIGKNMQYCNLVQFHENLKTIYLFFESNYIDCTKFRLNIKR